MANIPIGDVPESPFLWARGVAARETLRYLDKRGIESEPLLSKAELSRAQLSQEGNGVSVASQCRFLNLAAIETDDSLLGLHVAAEMDVRDSGILFYLMTSSRTVADALENLARYVGTTNEAVRIDISQRHPETVLTAHFGFDEPRRQASEFSTLAALRILGRATNRDFAPARLTFAHARNSELREVHRMLRCPVEFSHPADSWVLPQSVMGLPIASSDSRLLEILETHADHLLADRRGVAGLRGMVENQLLAALPNGKVQAATVARQLGMSMRSFTRRLAAEGTSFGEILDRLRNRLAVRYLEDERISLQQVAWLLGYSESAAFSHAFKRWFGISPSRARLQPVLPGSG
jgi:AraC-like DNA-binding protein